MPKRGEKITGFRHGRVRKADDKCTNAEITDVSRGTYRLGIVKRSGAQTSYQPHNTHLLCFYMNCNHCLFVYYIFWTSVCN